MRKFQNTNYSINKNQEEIIYQFADGSRVGISLQDYLKDNPKKTERDFAMLKYISNVIYYEQDREDTAYAKRKSILDAEESASIYDKQCGLRKKRNKRSEQS